MAVGDWALLVRQAEADAAEARRRLFAALYYELHRLAERWLRVNSGLPIRPTTLLHETYLSLTDGQAALPDRERFPSYAARAMCNLVIDFARAPGATARRPVPHHAT